MTVWIYVDTRKKVRDIEHLKVFATRKAAERWFEWDHPLQARRQHSLALCLAVREEKLVGPVEVSAVRPALVGPGQYLLCLRRAQSPSGPLRTHSVFFDNDVYKGSRLSAINEACEAEAFRPLK